MRNFIHHYTENEDAYGNIVKYWELGMKEWGEHTIKVSKLVGFEVLKFTVVDINTRFISATYREDFDDEIHLTALISIENNKVMKKDIISFEFIEKHDLFIIGLLIMDKELDMQFKKEYNTTFYTPTSCFGVIDKDGNYVIKPFYQSIEYRKEEDLLYATELLDETVGNSIFNASGQKVANFE